MALLLQSMTLVTIGVTTEIHNCTTASCDCGGKTNEIIIIIYCSHFVHSASKIIADSFSCSSHIKGGKGMYCSM